MSRWRHKNRKIAVEILRNVKNRTQTLREILRMVTIEIVINSLLGRLTQLPVCIVPVLGRCFWFLVSTAARPPIVCLAHYAPNGFL